jgi:hypothetical protein
MLGSIAGDIIGSRFEGRAGPPRVVTPDEATGECFWTGL